LVMLWKVKECFSKKMAN